MKNDLLQATISKISGHEFRTPMNAIFGFANLIHDSAGSISAAEQKEFSEYILNSARQLMNHSERLYRWYHYKDVMQTGGVAEKIAVEELIKLIEIAAEKYTVSGELFMFSSNSNYISIPGKKEVFFASISELFDNAFKFSAKHTIPGFSVVVSHAGNLLITVQNYSDKASSADLRKYTAFTQFNRQQYEQQGLGLGLEIAKLGILHCGGLVSIPEMADENGYKKICIQVSIPAVYDLSDPGQIKN